MRPIIRFLFTTFVATCLALSMQTQAAEITGAGATFPYPVYAKWAEAYNAKTGVKVNYQSIGSGGGIRQIQNKTVNFGASDMPLKPEQLEKDGLMQFPTVIGGDVPVVNIEGISSGKLKLTGEILADIFLKKITKWNDPAITAINPGLPLPNANITVVHRSDGSGTTFIWTDYLSKVSEEWKKKVGADTSVSWPTGVGGKGNEGVASYVQRIKNSIGYVEFAYAKQNGLTWAMVKNKDGEFVKPSLESFQAAARHAQWDKAPGFYEILTNEPGKDTWPISGATFILMHKVQDKPEAAREALKFFDWAYAEGDQMAESLGYVPLPEDTVKLIKNHWKTNMKSKDGSALIQ